MKFTWARTTITFGGPPQPIAQIFAPPVYGVFDQAKKYLETYSVDRTQDQWKFNSSLQESLVKADFDSAKKILRRLGNPTGDLEVRQILVDAFRQYGQAVEGSDWRDSFLELWRILEWITVRDKGEFSTKLLLQRTKTLLWKNASLHDALVIAHDARNELVHKGRFSEEGQMLVQELKQIVEVCIQSLNYLERKYPKWAQLEMFYTQAAALPDDKGKQEEYFRSLRLVRRLKNGT